MGNASSLTIATPIPAAAPRAAAENGFAQDWARAHEATRAVLQGAQAGVVYQRTWPPRDAVEVRRDIEIDHALRSNGWLDSTLDLRDGLSVVEVFTPSPATAAVLASVQLPRA